MDLWELITNDHANIDEMFREVLGAVEASDRDRRFDQLKHDLERHTRAEEDVFYPALERHEATRRFIVKARREHAEVKRMVEQLAQGRKDSEDWTRRFEQLQQRVRHHVQEEEGEIIPAAQSVLDARQANELLHRMERDMIGTLQAGG